MVLITGSSGLLGNALTRQLAMQYPDVQFIGLYHTTTPKYNYPNVSYVKCDLLDIVSLDNVFSNVDEVYHCAAIVSFDAKDKKYIVDSNIRATANIVNLCIDHKIRKLIHVSSVAAIGRDKKLNSQDLLTEENLWEENKHSSNYARSKYYSEMEVWRGIAEGLNAAIINPGIIIGAGDWNKSSNKLFKTIAKGQKYYTDGINAYVDVNDVVKAMMLLMKSKISGERYIISAGSYSYKEIFNLIAKQLGIKGPSKKASKTATAVIWRLATLKALITGTNSIITKETAHTAHAQYKYSNRKFIEAFPEFLYTPINEAISNASAFYKEKFMI